MQKASGSITIKKQNCPNCSQDAGKSTKAHHRSTFQWKHQCIDCLASYNCNTPTKNSTYSFGHGSRVALAPRATTKDNAVWCYGQPLFTDVGQGLRRKNRSTALDICLSCATARTNMAGMPLLKPLRPPHPSSSGRFEGHRARRPTVSQHLMRHRNFEGK